MKSERTARIFSYAQFTEVFPNMVVMSMMSRNVRLIVLKVNFNFDREIES